MSFVFHPSPKGEAGPIISLGYIAQFSFPFPRRRRGYERVVTASPWAMDGWINGFQLP
ncbi:MAG: hypothetical protein K9H64_23570 [Bacteroidales bacterium]|nr:hypothetical protein [Bacteroidales bacterium]MCF8459024.1 hypothetical protein [Bacteroidales bacterium]